MSYFIIKSTEDGISTGEYKDIDNLLKYLINDGIDIFFNSLPGRDPNEWESNRVLIIKGEVIVPKPKKIVLEWDVD